MKNLKSGDAMKLNILQAAALTGQFQVINDQAQLYTPFDTGSALGAKHGTVFAANDANFDAAHLSEPASELVAGARGDEGLYEALHNLAPVVRVGRSFDYRVHNTLDEFKQDGTTGSDIRPIDGDFPTTKPSGRLIESRTDNKGLVMVLDQDRGGSEDAVRQHAAVNLRNRLLRSEIFRGLALLDAAATNEAKTWSSGTPDPDRDVQIANDTGGVARGVDGNTVIWGKSAWIKRTGGHRGGSTGGAIASSGATPQAAAVFAGAARGSALPFRYKSSNTATSELGDIVLIFHAREFAMPDDPTNIKRFVSGTLSGKEMFAVYFVEKLKRTLVVVEHYSRLVITSTLGIQKLTIT